MYDVYYGYMIRCSSLWDVRHKPIMWAKMVEFLRKADSDRCAEWWQKNWQGPWTLAKLPWSFGELKFKCNCKGCYVRGCCRDSLLWSMVLNPKLIIPPKYAKREPALRKKRGRPTEKRVERLTEKQKEVDARPFVDKAPPRVSAYG